jgi:poly-gamma-glutamate capsule biosynthesis protein CapA/YwtB (metallophosphatase superfamily)
MPRSRGSRARAYAAMSASTSPVAPDMPAVLALAGDTMLGRMVAERLTHDPAAPLVSAQVAEAAAEADFFVLNLECCISSRGSRFPDPAKPFFFRAPPAAAERLAELRVAAVSLANNHALDYGCQALLDTIEHLDRAGIASVGAGRDQAAAREPVTLVRNGFRLRIVGMSSHPSAFAATPDRPGIAYVDLDRGRVPDWLIASARPAPDDDAVLVTPHWGPNMTPGPVRPVRAAARALAGAGATLVAGHSAHVFHGVAGNVIYDLGDFVDDYRIHPQLRNDLGLLWFVTLDRSGVRGIEALPLKLDYCFTRAATGGDWRLVRDLVRKRCAELGTDVEVAGERLAIDAGITRT